MTRKTFNRAKTIYKHFTIYKICHHQNTVNKPVSQWWSPMMEPGSPVTEPRTWGTDKVRQATEHGLQTWTVGKQLLPRSLHRIHVNQAASQADNERYCFLSNSKVADFLTGIWEYESSPPKITWDEWIIGKTNSPILCRQHYVCLVVGRWIHSLSNNKNNPIMH